MKNQEMFSYLPQEIILNILSRLPIKAVSSCKLVCKSWLSLLETPEFARSHLSKSVPGLLINQCTEETTVFKIFEFEDDSESVDRHELHYKRVLELDIVSPGSGTRIEGSTGGLLFFRKTTASPNDHYICNPITREYAKLPPPDCIRNYPTTIATYGFGVSRSSGHYKVVRIFHECGLDPKTFVCQVYTLGTGSWRSIVITQRGLESLEYSCHTKGTFFNGNLHWLVRDLAGSWWISCFDLETEAFTKFQGPVEDSRRFLMGLGVLRDRLCLCDNSSESEIVMYLMSYEERSWSKEYVIRKSPYHEGEYYEVVYPIKVFRDGDVLMAWQDFHLFCYSEKTKGTVSIDMFNLDVLGFVEASLYTPSLVSLGDFESVRKF